MVLVLITVSQGFLFLQQTQGFTDKRTPESQALPSLFDMASSQLPSLFSIRNSPGKGLGVYATARIPSGTLILREFPAMTSRYLASAEDPTRFEDYRDILSQFHDLNAETRRQILGLQIAKHAPGVLTHLRTLSEQGHILPMAVFFSNSLVYIASPPPSSSSAPTSTVPGNLSAKRGLYPWASRLNNSCDPNVLHDISSADGVLYCVAARDIEEGDELCISYVGAYLTHEARQMHFRTLWDFTCGCPRCLGSLGVSAVEDGLEIPEIGIFDEVFTQEDRIAVAAPAVNLDLSELWSWIALQLRRISEFLGPGESVAVYFPYVPP